MNHARHPRTAEEDQTPALEIASLIDVCFLLLIYFLATSTILPRESDLGMSLPAGTPPIEDAELEPLWIRIGASGDIQTGEPRNQLQMDTDASSRDLPLLRQHLAMFASASRAAGTLPLVRVEADDQCSHQRVIDVLNALASERIRAVTFSDPVP